MSRKRKEIQIKVENESESDTRLENQEASDEGQVKSNVKFSSSDSKSLVKKSRKGKDLLSKILKEQEDGEQERQLVKVEEVKTENNENVVKQTSKSGNRTNRKQLKGNKLKIKDDDMEEEQDNYEQEGLKVENNLEAQNGAVISKTRTDRKQRESKAKNVKLEKTAGETVNKKPKRQHGTKEIEKLNVENDKKLSTVNKRTRTAKTEKDVQIASLDVKSDEKSKKEVTSGRKRRLPKQDQNKVDSSKDNNIANTESNEMEQVPDVKKIKKGKQSKKQEEIKTHTKKMDGTQDVDKGSKFVGAHVSISGGLYKSVYEAKAINARAFAMFLRSTQRWDCKPLTDEAADKFKETMKVEGYSPDMVLPHGSYLMNCGSPDDETLQKSRDVLIDDLQRCERLGLKLFNFHPGSTCGKISVEKSLDRIAESINVAHSKTQYVIPVIENMSCQGNTIGGKFTELREIIDRVKDKSRIGVCLDTCHAFAAGYDLSTEEGFEKMITEFEETVGFDYLKAMHLNDSKGKLGCHKDRHENIGKGFIGKDGFRRVMNCNKFNGIPMVLETPYTADNTYLREIKLLNSYIQKT